MVTRWSQSRRKAPLWDGFQLFLKLEEKTLRTNTFTLVLLKVNRGILNIFRLSAKIDWNQTASNLADGSPEELHKMEECYSQKWAGRRKLYTTKKRVGYCKVTFLLGDEGVLSGGLPTSADLTGLRVPFWESQNWSSVKSWFGDVGYNISSLIWGWVPCKSQPKMNLITCKSLLSSIYFIV